MFFTQEKLEARTRSLEEYRFMELTPVAPLASMEGGLGPDEVYRQAPYRVEGPPLGLGDLFVGRDRYLWAEKTVTLPPRREGCEVYGLFDFGRTGGGHNSGFESLLYVDGAPYQGVDSNHMDVNLEPLWGRQVRLTFLLWTGLEGGGPPTDQQHQVRMAHIGYLHTATDQLYYLAKAIFKTVRLLPDSSTEKHALTAALEAAFRQVDWEPERFYTTVGPALAGLEEALASMPKQSSVTVSAVGHTHIDVAWLWRLKHTREKAMRSFSTALRLMEEFDEFRFLQTQPQLYRYIKNDCPGLYQQIKARIRDGRWEPDGGMWVEADCNLSSGESLVRQLVHGIRFFREEFGVECNYLWLPDVFGYSWALPQILKLAGLRTFMTTKISWNQYNTIPADLFRWRGIDGTEILTYFITTPEEGRPLADRYSTYNGMLSPRTVLGSWEKFKNKNLSNETLISYGFGDGGGGVNRNMLNMRRAMDRIPGLPRVRPTTARDFFDRLHRRVEETGEYVHTWDGELYLEYHRGTYTAQAENKRMNRRMEYALAQAEWLSCLGYLGGGDYPGSELYSLWEGVLLHQFHDIIPGSSIREVYQDSHLVYRDTEQRVAALAASALSSVTKAEDNRFTVVNPCSFERAEPVLLPLEEDGLFRDDRGAALPAQRVEGGWLVQPRVPALGMAGLAFQPGAPAPVDGQFRFDPAQGLLDTPLYEIKWNAGGHLCSLYDKARGRQVLAGNGGVLEVYEDKPLNYDNWDIDIFHTEKRETAVQAAPPALIEEGPLRAVVRFHFTYNRSAFTVDMTAYRDCPRIDFIAKASWQESGRLLKVAFPVDVRSTKATYDIQFGHVERPTHWNTSWDWARFEVVGHRWADLSEPDYGVSLLNNCKYGYSIKDNVMRLTLLKSTKHPDTEMDMGDHAFTYSLLPHGGTPAQGVTIAESAGLNQPLWAVAGALADPRRLVRISPEGVEVDALKKAEDNGCLILRLHECRGKRCPLTVESDFHIRAWTPCNLLEEELAPPTDGERIEAVLRPFEIKTFKLWID